MSDKIGEILVKAMLISDSQLKSAMETQKQVGGNLAVILVKLRYITEDKLAEQLGKELNLPVLSLKEMVVSPKVSALLDVELLEKHQILPVKRSEDTLLVAAADPMNYAALDEVHFLTNLKVQAAVATRSNIQKALDYYFHGRACKELEEAEAGGPKTAAPAAAGPSQVQVLKALVDVLIEKKVVTREELLAKVNQAK